MRCARCSADNPDDARFCAQCGQRLALSCPACSHEVGAADRFCSHCGTRLDETPVVTEPEASPAPIGYTPSHLSERIRAEQAALVARAGAGGERKTISVLFADMAGSTALIHGLDPEEVRQLIDPVLALMMEAVHHYEGYVAKSLGDGILALFGAPIAHEDHAQRALYAALRMQDAMRRYADRLRLAQGIPLQIRIGIHTGEVVVRSIRTEDLRTDYDPVGQTIHIASRMEGIATPGTIVVSEATHRLTEGYIAYRALGVTPVKGLPEPMAAYEVLGLGPLRTRLQVAASRGLAPFVGRHGEMAQLKQAFQRACRGEGQIVGVVGEPGVGKSRLFYEFKQASQKSCLVLETFSVSHGKAFPYRPLIELLRNYLHLGPQDDERRRREMITGKILTLDRSLEAGLPYLFYLLGLDEPDSELARMDPMLRRQRTFEAIKRILERESLDQPLELIFEDLQWLDRETEAFLDYFSVALANAPILLLVNYRPEYRHHWGPSGYYTQLRLDPLGQAEAAELLDALLGDDASLTALRPRLLTQTEGNPFFIEEVVQTLAEEQVLEGEAGHYRLRQMPEGLHIPTSVQGVLGARIDRLAAGEKELLQTLAVIGKEFPWSLVQRVLDQPEEALRRGLARLQAGEFIYERPAFPEVEYTFKHGLTQQVAYGSLLLERRRLLHERTAGAIEALFGDRLEEHCGELAYHYSHSDNAAKAIEYLRGAARQAVQRSANQEAEAHLSRALELLESLPASTHRDEEELALQTAIGPVLMATRGYAAPEVEACCTRALALSRALGETAQQFSALLGLRRFHNLRADYRRAQELGERLLDEARRTGEEDLLLEAHGAQGSTLFFRGELMAARQHLEAVIALYDPQRHGGHAVRYGLDPGVLARMFLACTLWFQGRPEAAIDESRRTLELAQQLAHTFSLSFALGFTTQLYQFGRDAALTLERAEAAVALSTEQGFPFWLSQAEVLRGWALAQLGQQQEGLAVMRAGLEAYRASGARLGCSYLQALLAESLAGEGKIDDALAVIAEAQAFAEDTGEGFYAAELHRLKGALLLERGDATGAEVCFRQAVEIARAQGTCALELRAQTALSRLWQAQGRRGEARAPLEALYAGFDEGFDSADLQEARALLDELA
jgi:class 3 adenylate cyclase/predicted ATPase